MSKHRKTITLPTGQPAPAMPESLTQQVYENLKEEILRAQRAPGEMVAEPELAARYGVSKTPIREALRILLQDGWVTALPRKGYLIRPLALEDVREVFALRQMLEPELSAETARRRTDAQLRELSELVDRQADAKNELEGALLAARQFHTLIAESAGNSRAVRMLEGLLDEVRRLHYLMPQLEVHITSSDEVNAHRDLVDALIHRDADRAADRMRAHLLEAGTAMVEVFGGLNTSRRRA
jgi:GntR family transcriptional regulator, rspAB operon transcriptional repressor